jgi:hypothetical protein
LGELVDVAMGLIQGDSARFGNFLAFAATGKDPSGTT